MFFPWKVTRCSSGELLSSVLSIFRDSLMAAEAIWANNRPILTYLILDAGFHEKNAFRALG
jgi:hypothetical protein